MPIAPPPAATGAGITLLESLGLIPHTGPIHQTQTAVPFPHVAVQVGNTCGGVVVIPRGRTAAVTLLESLGLIPHTGAASADYGDDAVWANITSLASIAFSITESIHRFISTTIANFSLFGNCAKAGYAYFAISWSFVKMVSCV